jgi:DNA repair exonuclease SbcCD ATPase subunit
MEFKPVPLEGLSSSTKLIEKRRMLYEIQEAFERQKEEERKKESEFKQTEDLLRGKDLSVQEHLIQFNQFLIDNENKKNKARLKYEDEVKQKLQREAKIELLNAEIEQLREKSRRMEQQVKRIGKYEQFLDLVKERYPDEFADIGEITSRYNTLSDTYQMLLDKRQRLDAEFEELKRTKDTLEKTRKDEVLELNINIAVLQKEIDDAELQRNDLQKESDINSQTSLDKDLELGVMLTSIESLFTRCITAGPKIDDRLERLPKGERSSYDDYSLRAETAKDKLGSIEKYLGDFRRIIDSVPPETRARMNAAKRTIRTP